MTLDVNRGFTFGLVAGEYGLLHVALQPVVQANEGRAVFRKLLCSPVADPLEVGKCQ